MSRSLNIRSLPDDVLRKVRGRMQRDGWYSLSDLATELLRDYAEERSTPTAAPPAFDPTRQPGARSSTDER